MRDDLVLEVLQARLEREEPLQVAIDGNPRQPQGHRVGAAREERTVLPERLPEPLDAGRGARVARGEDAPLALRIVVGEVGPDDGVGLLPPGSQQFLAARDDLARGGSIEHRSDHGGSPVARGRNAFSRSSRYYPMAPGPVRAGFAAILPEANQRPVPRARA